MDITPKLLTRISIFVKNLLDDKRPLTIDENKHLVLFAKSHAGVKMDTAEFVMKTSMEYFESLTNKPVFSLSDEFIDPHEMLKEIITENIDPTDLSVIKRERLSAEIKTNINSISGIKSLMSFAKTINPESMYKKGYVTLDSNAAVFSNNNTDLRWDYVSVRQESDNTSNTTARIRDVVSMRIYSVVLEKFSTTLNRGTIYVHEFGRQCFIAPSGYRFHTVTLLNDLENPLADDLRNQQQAACGFTEDWLINNKYELLMGYRFNDGIYNFHTPITSFDSLTLSFGEPFTKINIPKHKITGVTATSLNYSGNSFVFVTPEPHYLPANIYSIRVEGFTTDDPVSDANLITFMAGFEFTVATTSSPSTITITPKNISVIGTHPTTIQYYTALTLNPVGNPLPFTILLDGFRVIVNMELTYIDPSINV